MQQMQDASDDPTDASACAEQLLEVVPLIMRTIRAMMRAERGDDLSVLQFRALGYIGRHPQTSLTAVAEHLGLSVAATSRLVGGLVDRKLVVRDAAPEDRRYVTLRLSPDGDILRTAARRHALHSLSALLRPLPAADREAIERALPPLRAIFDPAGPTPVARAHAAPERMP